jgi:hypothetical protein
VKASEEASNVDTSSMKGWLTVKALQGVFTAAGMIVSAAEVAGLKQPHIVAF